MFRASPWINYEPGGDNRNLALPPDHHPAHYNNRARLHYNIMNDDVDMEAPQISTLREEETPPPQRPNPTRGKFRVNLLVGEKKGTGSPSASGSRKIGGQSEEEDEEQDELEEDQLIDDEEEGGHLKRPLSVTVPPVSAKSKAAPRKRPRKSEKSEAISEPPRGDVQEHHQTTSISEALPPKVPKKKAAPKKPAASAKPKAKATPKTPKSLALPQLEDNGAVSEAYTGTAASSPAPHDANTPEPDMAGAPSVTASEVNLDSIALPIYPLPSKPFPVQPPPKIGTGFAPVIPLDKSTNKPRRWRTANREIRGIAGGRWFARSWVGDKDSEVAAAAATAATAAAILKANMEADKRATGQPSAMMTSLPQLPSLLMAPSASKGLPRPTKSLKATPSTSVGPSRAPSIVSEPASHAPRPPTKMRNMLAAPSSEAEDDSDTVTAPVS